MENETFERKTPRGKTIALFLCNCRFETWRSGFIEEFHVRYINGREENKGYQYKNPREHELGFYITDTGEVIITSDHCEDGCLRFDPMYYFLSIRNGGKKSDAVLRAYEILEQATDDEAELAFIFAVDCFDLPPTGIVLRENGKTLPRTDAIEKMQLGGNEYSSGIPYLAMVKKDMTVVVHELKAHE